MRDISKGKLLAYARLCAIPVSILWGFWDGRTGASIFIGMNYPITWGNLLFVILGMSIGIFFIVGIQALRKKPQFVRMGWWFLAIGSLYFGSMGIMVLLLALRHETNIQPADFFFLSAAFGMLLGLGMVRLACRSAFSASSNDASSVVR